MQDSRFIGLDVHKATIPAAAAQGERGGEVRHRGSVPHRPDPVRTLAKKLAAGAFGTFQRGQPAAGRDRQGGQLPCPARADRGRMELPQADPRQPEAPRPAAGAAAGGARHCLEGAAQDGSALSASGGGGKAKGVVITAITRKRAGFIRAIARAVTAPLAEAVPVPV
jgi:hypothetical protein